MNFLRFVLSLAAFLQPLITSMPTAFAQSGEPLTDSDDGGYSNPTDAPREEAATDRDEKILERITVVGSPDRLSEIPGSAAFLDGEQLDEAKTGLGDITRALRTVPGLNIVEEDGYGLRPNIGMRGTPSERSNSITLMEDGVLIAPAPYAAPAAYFFPSFARMAGVEVLKGAGQIKYGPRTTGGSLNMLSTAIPSSMKVSLDAAAGSYDTQRAHLYVGDSFRYGGYLLETFQLHTDGFKELDNGEDTGFDLGDYVAKFRINTDKDAEMYQQLQFKFGYYEQDADETYLGLTSGDFAKTPLRRYAASQNDKVEINQYQYSLQHYIELSDKWDVTTTGYYNTLDRRWNKLDSVGGQSLSTVLEKPADYADAFSWLTGEDSPENALTMRDADRNYFARGVQTVMVGKVDTDLMDHRIEFGARYHQDQEDRQQVDNGYQMLDGDMVQTLTGVPLSQTNRIGYAAATALYLQDTVTAGKWRFIPGLRFEDIKLVRKDYGKVDPDRSGESLKENTNHIDVVIPGIGAEYSFSPGLAAFAGVHKGFSPPGPSDVQGLKPEESIAYELGTNIKRNSLVSQVTFFYNDYDNLLGQDSLSSGGTGSGDQFNLGKAFTYGVESSLRYDLNEWFGSTFNYPVYATYTYTDAEFDSTFFSDQYGQVNDGDKIPYISPNQFALGAGVEHQDYGKLLLRSYFVEAMYTEPSISSDVRGPKTDSYYVVDAHVESPDLGKGVRIYADFTNLFDNQYIVAWRPAGARPGAPFTALGGIKFAF